MIGGGQYILDLNGELLIDNYAGGGGASTGIEMALGRHVDIAINHNPKAVAMHKANHPQTKHYCESVWEVDPKSIMPERPVALVWLSPDCTHFSKAKGGKPVKQNIRGLAWIALRWASARDPRIFMLENVEEFLGWGPLLENGKPCPKRKGETYEGFMLALTTGLSPKHPSYRECVETLGIEWDIKERLKIHKGFGHKLETRIIRACDFGAPTIRKRLFLIARRDKQPIVWPEETHISPKELNPKRLKLWRTVAECIDWSIPCPSIFERKKDLAENTLRRVAKGIIRYVINAANPFIKKIPFEDTPENKTKKGNVVAPFINEHANASNQRVMAIDEPVRTLCAKVKGGHFSVVSALLAKHYTGAVGSSMKAPVGTVTSIDHHSLVATNMVKMRGDNVGSATDEPLHTISAGGTHHAEVRTLLTTYNEENQDGTKKALYGTTEKGLLGLVKIKNILYQIIDIGLRMLSPRELFRCQGFDDSYIIGDDESQGLKLTKVEQVQMVGNSVSPPVACALVRANLSDLIVYKQDKAA